MHQGLFEILIPAGRNVQDEDFFMDVETRVRHTALAPADRKKVLVIAMEMFQNMKRHGNHAHLALLRISEGAEKSLQITSINFADTDSARRLSGKHDKLLQISDYRKNFRQTLLNKMKVVEPAGNLGLDICFRNSSGSILRTIPQPGDLKLIFLSFSVGNYGKTAA